VKVTDTVPHDKMPMVGAVLPVSVSASDPQHLEIDWDAAPDITEMVRASSAAARRGDISGAARELGFELRDPPAEE
jgi:hypothetical protein